MSSHEGAVLQKRARNVRDWANFSSATRPPSGACGNSRPGEGQPMAVENKTMAKLTRVGTMTDVQQKPTVLIVDDDPDVREALQCLLRSVGLESRAMASLPKSGKLELPSGPTCLVLDVRLPERSGLDFQRELSAANVNVPIIFMTAHGDVPMSVQAMKGGAIEFLIKPFRDQDLLDAIQLGLTRDRVRLDRERELDALRERYDTLTAREREVMEHVVRGRINKQIAGDIGISEMTVKIHRGNLTRKMRAPSLADLARMADMLIAAGLLRQTQND
jgi:FixJ family two-component response regulator